MGLVTLDNVKTFLGITNNEQDDVLNMLIDQVSKLIETKTGRTFEQTTYTNEEYDGTGTRELKLKHIITFTRLQKNNAVDNRDDWETIDEKDYWVDTETGIITRVSPFSEYEDSLEEANALLSDSIFFKGKNRYRATYTAGYETIPDDIQYVCMSLISNINFSRKTTGLKSESLGDHRVEFQSMLDKDSYLMDILASYRDKPLAD